MPRIGGVGAILAVAAVFFALAGGVSSAAGPGDATSLVVPQDSLNPAAWIESGQKALKSGHGDVAKSYFDQAIKYSKRQDSVKVVQARQQDSLKLVRQQDSLRVVRQQDSLRVVRQQDSIKQVRLRDSLNPAPRMEAGLRALKAGKEDSAKIYFDEAIKLSGNARDTIMHVGMIWFEYGKLEGALPYLFTNLSALDPGQLDRLDNTLVNSRYLSAALTILRYHASLSKQFSPQAALAAKLAFGMGEFTLCRDILVPYAGELDSGSVDRLLLSNFYVGGKLDPSVIQKAAARSNISRVRSLAAMNEAILGNFKDARTFVSGGTPQPVQSYVKGQELDAAEKTDKAVEYFQQALDSKWPEFHEVVLAELYNHYASTGNRFKADQLWETIKSGAGADTVPALEELLAYQLGLRGYEKQSRVLYRNLYASNPNRPGVLQALWEELIVDDSTGVNDHINALLAVDPLDCMANQLSMRYHKARNHISEVVRTGRNVSLYCPDAAADSYLDLATALQGQGRAEEAKVYFGKYIEHGGDKTRVPVLMR